MGRPRFYTEEQVQQMIDLRNQGLSYLQIAKIIPCDHSTVMLWVKRRKDEIKDLPRILPGPKPSYKKPVIRQKTYKQLLAEQPCKHSRGAYLNNRCWICKSLSTKLCLT